MFINGRPLPGLTISGSDTYETWDMMPTSRLHIAPPEVKTAYVDLPGANGGLDYTELLTGNPTYGYRKGSWEFMLIPGERWANVYRSLMTYLHGRQHTIILNDDPEKTYTGRMKINEWKSSAYNSLITIDYVIDPFAVGSESDPQTQFDLMAATRLLKANPGKVISLVNGSAAITNPS